MPEYLAPGVYVEETQSTNKPIEGVSTSTTGLVGVTERGPVDCPQLVTSVGEFRRLFGDLLPQDGFTDPATGRRHCYLPHAVEGFFVNGGKRAWVTRVVPAQAERAARNLFFADPTPDLIPVPAGDTVLLRSAAQSTGSAVNLPPLVVLDPANLALNDWVRIGEGSTAEYRQVQSIGAAASHTALNFPLHFSHPTGALARRIALTPAAPALTPLALGEALPAGASELTVRGAAAIITNLVAALPPGARQLLQIGPAAAAEYSFATTLVQLSTTTARLTLAAPLRLPYAASTAVAGLGIPAGVNVPLRVAASAGELLIYGPAWTTVADLAVVGIGSPEEEVLGIGQLALLPLALDPYAPYPAGTLGRRITAADDRRSITDLPSNLVVPLNTVAGMAAGMTITRGADAALIGVVEPLLGLVRLATPLGGAALAAGDAVTVGALAATVLAYPSARVIPLGSVNGIAPGMIFDDAGDQAPVANVLTDLRIIVLASPLAAAPAVAAAVTVGGNAFTVAELIRDDCVPLDDVSALTPGMAITVNGDTRTISAVNASLGAVALQTPLSAVPAAGDTASLDLRHTTALAGPGATTLTLDNRLGLEAGDLLRIGVVPDEEYATIARVLGERGAPPDAGVVQLGHPLGEGRPTGTPSGTGVMRQRPTLDLTRQPAILALAAGPGQDEILASDGTGFAAGDLILFTTPDGVAYCHRLDGPAIPADPRELVLDAALGFGHAAGAPLLERVALIAVQALDAGAWGNRLQIATADEPGALVPNAEVLAANPPPGPGLFSSLLLATTNGVEAGSLLELLDPDGVPVAGAALLKARRVDRPNRLVLLDPPGLQPVHMNAVAAALGAGLRARIRSREFSLTVLVRRRPDPAIPVRNDDLIDQEGFRQLSMDPRHSRYFERVIGVTFTPGAPTDDAGNPLRSWDRRSEGGSAYCRVRDLEPLIADRQRPRLGPETLTDRLPSGLTRAARLPLAGGDDAPALMDDALYIGTDDNEPDRRTGLHSLRNPQSISLVAIPGQTSPAIQQALIDHCEDLRYRFTVLDGPPPTNDTLIDVQNQRALFDSRYAALYHPWLTIPDPFPTAPGTPPQYPIPPSGHVLGLFARVDDQRGVHKAPANEVLRGIRGLTRYLNAREQEVLNPSPTNINVIRAFPNRGVRIWGARCITGDTEYKYINVRRLLIFLEASIDQGMQWVVFEPNAPELWARVRRSVTNFLTTVWRNGALEGETPERGFYVRCDRSTMTQDDLDNGRLIVVIGVAPVKPAEFVIIRIGLWTADAEA